MPSVRTFPLALAITISGTIPAFAGAAPFANAVPSSPPLCGGVPATIVGTMGADILIGTEGVDVITGLAGNDTIWGHSGADIICAGDGNDLLAGESGRDRLHGGAGVDVAGYGNAPGAIQAYLADGIVRAPDGRDRVASIESVVGSAFDDRIVGDHKANVLIGLGGFDRIAGGAGTDSCDGELEFTCEG